MLPEGRPQEFIQSPRDQKIAQNLRACSDLFDIAYRLKSHRLRSEHPEWNEAEIHRLTLEAIERGTR